jgi:hypothetical protein
MADAPLKATPPPDERIVRDTLLHILRAQGLEPEDSWLSVRLAHAPWSRERTYTLVIAYHAAGDALLQVLRHTAGLSEQRLVGIWVLNESEARELCQDASNGA